MEEKCGRWAGDGDGRRRWKVEEEEERRKGTDGEQEDRTKPQVRTTLSLCCIMKSIPSLMVVFSSGEVCHKTSQTLLFDLFRTESEFIIKTFRLTWIF